MQRKSSSTVGHRWDAKAKGFTGQRVGSAVRTQNTGPHSHTPPLFADQSAQDSHGESPATATPATASEGATPAKTRPFGSPTHPPHPATGNPKRRTRAGSLLLLDPVEEGFLDGLARLAQLGDRLLRDRLYARFSPYLDRVCASLARRSWVRLAELDDIRHEGYLVFCELLADWPGEERFAGFLFAHFARRLAAAVRRFEGLRSRGPLVPPPLCDPTPDDGAAAMAVCELLAGLTPADQALVELLLAGHTLREAAARLGMTERTARRRLRRLRQQLRR